MYLLSFDLLINSNIILKGVEDNGVGFIFESNGSLVIFLNIINSSKGYINLKEVVVKLKFIDIMVLILIIVSYYVYDINKVKFGVLEVIVLINVKYD